MNHVVIGDVHGCIETLRALLEKVASLLNGEPYKLYFVGDLIDRGPSSDRVCDLVMAKGATCVLGGHEEKMLRFWRGECGKSLPAKRTRKQISEASYGEFFRDMPLFVTFVSEGQTFAVLHAGVMPGVPLSLQAPEHLLRLRRIKGGKPSKNVPDAVGWWSLWEGPEHIIFGHVNSNTGPILAPHATGIDTSCCYGHTLSCVVFPGRTIISVPCRDIER